MPENEETISAVSRWPDDVIGLDSTADFLSDYMRDSFAKQASGHPGGIVMALDAEWGIGKSFFLRNWAADLRHQNHTVAFFDAWVNDFSVDPLIAFLAEIRHSLQPDLNKVPPAKRAWKKVMRSARMAIGPGLELAAKVAVKKITGESMDAIKGMFDNSSETAGNSESGVSEVPAALDEKQLDKLFEALLSTHQQKKDAISAFRSSLEELVNALLKEPGKQLPVFILIDELDRCRPTYAIELLEGIKHLFGVPGICFVVATNLAQMSESTKAVYGAGFDGYRYLKKFFDVHYVLPKPDNRSFAKLLFKNVADSDRLRLVVGLDGNRYKERNNPEEVFALYSAAFNLTLRDQQQVMSILQAVLPPIKAKNVFCHYLFFLAMLRHRSSADFDAWLFTGKQEDKAVFETLIKSWIVEPVAVEFVRPRSDYQSPPSEGSVKLSDIVWLYHANAQKSLVSVHKVAQEINSCDFPQSLLHKVAEEVPSRYDPTKFYPSSLRAYGMAVRQAGHIVG
jgi:hypothetical protein